MTLFGIGCGSVTLNDPDAGDCTENTCECDVDTDCDGPHEVCDITGPGRICACAPGYERLSDVCEWGVAPRDPGFEDGTAWQTSRGAGVSPLATGQIEAGEAFFSTDATCALGEVWQSFDMPTWEQSEPFVAVVNYRSLGGDMFGGGTGAAVDLGGGWRYFPVSSEWSTRRVCLGERAYGGSVKMGVSAADIPYDCGNTPTSMVAVDHFKIAVADPGECAPLGEVLNGDFETQDNDSWEPLASGTNATAGIVSGYGQNNSYGGRMTTQQKCSSASLAGRASWPSESVQHPALEVWWSGTNGALMELRLDNRLFAEFTGTGSPQTTRICVPNWAHGSETAVRWELPFAGGLCADPDVRDFRIDNLRVVNDPGCGDSAYLADPGFETATRAELRGVWDLTYAAGRGLAELRNNPNQTHSGAGVLTLMVQQQCSVSRAETQIVVPEPVGTNGPALKFWFKTGTNPESTFYSTPGNGILPEGGDWQQSTVCLNPILAGRPIPLQFTIDRGSGTCANVFPAEYAWVDDIEVTTDAACPAE